MQSEPFVSTLEQVQDNSPTGPERTHTQHGPHREYHLDQQSLSQRDEQISHHASGSEWSRSPSSAPSPSRLSESELDTTETASSRSRDFFDEGVDDTDAIEEQSGRVRAAASRRDATAHHDRFPLLEFPEELLFHVISHLTASDLLNVKLVSRRLHDIVESPHAWINAFSKYFPGPDALNRTADNSVSSIGGVGLRSETRAFTRLNPVASWTGEYLSRTKLLRCLGRGKPALPFAAPSPGKPNKGYATFTYSSRLNFGISHLHAKFGPVLDKRLPHFIHGFNRNGMVSSSDRRGKLDGWGLIERGSFQNFSDLYPGVAQWGLGSGEIVGIPNSMDLSSTYGMIYGEGIPGGSVYYLANGERHGRHVSILPNSDIRGYGIPKISAENTTVCSLWIAKTSNIPRMTKNLIGVLCGASNGIISGFSLGISSDPQQKWDRGDLTVRWVLSPGVPIIAIVADDEYSENRRDQGRVWAFAVNALGEIFSLSNIPEAQHATRTDDEMEPELARELQAWRTGESANWRLVRSSQRVERTLQTGTETSPTYHPVSVFSDHSVDSLKAGLSPTEINTWILRRPIDIRADFIGWDMQRRIEADFAGDDSRGGGENIVVFECGIGEEPDSAGRRYTRCISGYVLEGNSTSNVTRAVNSAASEPSKTHKPEHEWRYSRISFGRFKMTQISTTAIDASHFAVTTCAEDLILKSSRQKDASRSSRAPEASEATFYSPLKAPGQRARYIAAGTTSGKIFLWNIRAPSPGSVDVINEIRPLRIIHTDSPDITALALTALYIVHGGSEGLVQAWDPLASTLEPIRTISSRNTLNARRRAVIAAQQNPLIQAQMVVGNYAATAVCLDPDPSILRGIVAIGSHLRYWSYSSTAAADDLSKTQKRRLNRVARGLPAKAGGDYLGTRRVSLKGVVSQEVAEQALEDKDRRAAEKEHRRLAGRFGLDLLGRDASEEDLIAYAKLLSEEEQEMGMMHAAQMRLGRYASFGEIEAFKNELNEDDLEQWQFASWQQRFEMPRSQSRTPTAVPVSTPAMPDGDSVDADLEEAIRLSLGKDAIATSSSPRSSETTSSPAPEEVRAYSSGSLDADIAEAIRLSLTEAGQPSKSSMYKPSVTGTSARSAQGSLVDVEDDIAEAIKLSLQEQDHSATRRGSSSPSNLGVVVHFPDEQDFPALTARSPTSGSPVPGKDQRKGRGKGKGPAVWS